jgi:hypothetical protein
MVKSPDEENIPTITDAFAYYADAWWRSILFLDVNRRNAKLPEP